MLFIYTIISFVAFVLGSSEYVPRVKTPKGVVVGYHKQSYNGRTYSAFEGIPYAKKPVGELRFEVSQTKNYVETFSF